MPRKGGFRAFEKGPPRTGKAGKPVKKGKPAPRPAGKVAPAKPVPAKPAPAPAPAKAAPVKGQAPKNAPKRPKGTPPGVRPDQVKAAPVAKAPAPVAPARKAPKPAKVPEGPPRAGFALLLGKPNVGKSTLLNRLVGEHIAAVSPRPQTTRHRILGMVTRPQTQLVLVDAPGVHKAQGLMNRAMVEAAMTAMGEVDAILYLAEAGWPEDAAPGSADVVGPFHRELLREVGKTKKPVILVLTKVDLIAKPKLLPVMEAWSKAFEFRDIYPLSALTGENVEGLVDVARRHLPEGEPLFAPDQVTDQPERALVAEYIREQVFLHTRQEIPYGTAVTVDDFDESQRPADDLGDEVPAATLGAEPEDIDAAADEADAFEGDEDDLAEDGFAEDELEEGEETEEDGGAEVPGIPQEKPLANGLVRVSATIVVERPTHKGIIIGKGGEMLKTIGSAARARIERLLGCRVWLSLHVRVIPGWTEKRALLAEFGFLQR